MVFRQELVMLSSTRIDLVLGLSSVLNWLSFPAGMSMQREPELFSSFAFPKTGKRGGGSSIQMTMRRCLSVLSLRLGEIYGVVGYRRPCRFTTIHHVELEDLLLVASGVSWPSQATYHIVGTQVPGHGFPPKLPLHRFSTRQALAADPLVGCLGSIAHM